MTLRPEQPPTSDMSSQDPLASGPGLVRLWNIHRANNGAHNTGEHEVVQFPGCEAYMEMAVQEISKPETVEIVNALGEHHSTTRRHVFGVTVLLAKLLQVTGEELNLTQEEKTSMMRAALLHDTGKLDVSRDILDFNGGLTEQEFSMVQTHAVMGREILASQDAYKDDKILLGLTLLHHQVRPEPYPYINPDEANKFIEDLGYDVERFRCILAVFAMADQTEAMTGSRGYVQAKHYTKQNILTNLRQSMKAFGGSSDIVDFIEAQPYVWDKDAQRHDINALETAFVEAGGVILGDDMPEPAEQTRANLN